MTADGTDGDLIYLIKLEGVPKGPQVHFIVLPVGRGSPPRRPRLGLGFMGGLPRLCLTRSIMLFLVVCVCVFLYQVGV